MGPEALHREHRGARLDPRGARHDGIRCGATRCGSAAVRVARADGDGIPAGAMNLLEVTLANPNLRTLRPTTPRPRWRLRAPAGTPSERRHRPKMRSPPSRWRRCRSLDPINGPRRRRWSRTGESRARRHHRFPRTQWPRTAGRRPGRIGACVGSSPADSGARELRLPLRRAFRADRCGPPERLRRSSRQPVGRRRRCDRADREHGPSATRSTPGPMSSPRRTGTPSRPRTSPRTVASGRFTASVARGAPSLHRASSFPTTRRW